MLPSARARSATVASCQPERRRPAPRSGPARTSPPPATAESVSSSGTSASKPGSCHRSRWSVPRRRRVASSAVQQRAAGRRRRRAGRRAAWRAPAITTYSRGTLRRPAPWRAPPARCRRRSRRPSRRACRPHRRTRELVRRRRRCRCLAPRHRAQADARHLQPAAAHPPSPHGPELKRSCRQAGPATVAPRVVARSRRAGDRAGADGVPADLLVRPPAHRVGGVLRQRPGRRLHGGDPARHRGGRARLLRPRHRPPRRGVVPRPAQPRGARRSRLPPGVAGDHRHDPDRRARGAVQAPDRDGGPQPVADRDHDGRVRRAAGARRVLRAAEDRAAAA